MHENNSVSSLEVDPLLKEILNRPIRHEEKLISGKILNSIEQVDLVILLESTFSIKITAFDLTPDNFDNSELIAKFINQKRNT